MSVPSTSRRPSALTPTATITATDDPAVPAHLHVGRVDPEVGPVVLQVAVEEAVTRMTAVSAFSAIRRGSRKPGR
jgi:hypothetical protein